jgi:flagellar biosynthesis chaperone FliJ
MGSEIELHKVEIDLSHTLEYLQQLATFLESGLSQMEVFHSQRFILPSE